MAMPYKDQPKLVLHLDSLETSSETLANLSAVRLLVVDLSKQKPDKLNYEAIAKLMFIIYQYKLEDNLKKGTGVTIVADDEVLQSLRAEIDFYRISKAFILMSKDEVFHTN